MKASEGTQDILLIHAALVALTPLIPLPFVDDIAKSQLQRRMVRALAERRKLGLESPAVATLADDADGAALRGLGRRLALVPLKFVLKRLLLVLRGKTIIDLASRTYHRGFLMDVAFAHGLAAPQGSASAAQIRAAVDEVLATVPVAQSPITRALREGLDHSRRTLLGAFDRLRGEAPSNVDAAIDAAAETLAREGSLVDEMQQAFGAVPASHLERLERALLEALAHHRPGSE